MLVARKVRPRSALHNWAPLEIDGGDPEVRRPAAERRRRDDPAYARRQQTVSEHQQRSGQYLRLRAFATAAGERLARFLEDEALRLDRPGSLLARRGPGCATNTSSRRPTRCCAARWGRHGRRLAPC